MYPANVIQEAAARSHWLGLAVSLVALSAGCSIVQRQRLSFAGPLIEGVRAFTVVSPDGSDPQPLFGSVPGLKEVLVWSPDGDLVIVEQQQGDFYIADPADGSLGQCLTCGLSDALTAYFSPDGEEVTVGADSGLYLINADSTNLRPAAELPSPRWIHWSPDGTQIVFASRPNPGGRGRMDVYLLNLGNGSVTNLTGGKGGEGVDYFSPRWSPDGTKLAFHSLDDAGFHVMTIHPDGEGLRRVTDWAFQGEISFYDVAWPPQWSPDGSQLAFYSFDEPGVDFNADIFVVNPDGTGRTNLTHNPSFDSDPTWSPDGKHIAFVSNRDGNGEIFVMRSDGGDPVNVSNSPITDEVNPIWRP
jgi:TolB protein